jgi:O-antigen ligase
MNRVLRVSDRPVGRTTARTRERVGATRRAVVSAAELGDHCFDARWWPSLRIAIWLIPFQAKLPGIDRFHFAPSDLFLLSAAFMMVSGAGFARRLFTGWHLAIVIMFVASTLISGSALPYALGNKTLGLMLLMVFYACVASAATEPRHAVALGREFVLAVGSWSLVALVFHGAERLGLPTPISVSFLTDRVQGFLQDPNAFGGLNAVALLIVLGAHFNGRPLFRTVWFARLMIGALALSVLLSFSRSAWVALVVGGLVIARYQLVKTAVAIIGAASVLTLWLLAFPGFADRATGLASRKNSTDSRVVLLDEGLKAWRSHPVFGIGLGTSFDRFDNIIHNTTFWILTELGAVGLILTLLMFGWHARQWWEAMRRASNDTRPMLIGCGAALVSLFVLSQGIEAMYQRSLWVVLGITAALWHTSAQSAVTDPSIRQRRTRRPPVGRRQTPDPAWLTRRSAPRTVGVQRVRNADALRGHQGALRRDQSSTRRTT